MNNLSKDFEKARLAKIKVLEGRLAELTRVWEDQANNVNAKDYIWKSDGKRTLITEHKYSDNSKFRGYKIQGTFTDNIGNYGEWNTLVFAVISNSKINKLELFKLN